MQHETWTWVSKILAFALLTTTLAGAGCLSRDTPSTEDEITAPLGVDDNLAAVAPFLRREFDWQLRETRAMAEKARNAAVTEAATEAIEASDANVDEAVKEAESGWISGALDYVWRAYPGYYSVAEGFGAPLKETRKAAIEGTPRRLADRLSEVSKKIEEARRVAVTEGAIRALSQPELELLEAQAILESDRPETYPELNLSDPTSCLDVGGDFGRAARRIRTAEFWIEEARSVDLQQPLTEKQPFVWTAEREERARSKISEALEGAEKLLLQRPEGGWFHHLATKIYPYAAKRGLERGWLEGALEAALRAESLSAVVVWVEERHAIDPDEVVVRAWRRATAPPLFPDEAREAALAGVYLRYNLTLFERRGVEALIVSASEHRLDRVLIYGGGDVPGSDARGRDSTEGPSLMAPVASSFPPPSGGPSQRGAKDPRRRS